MVTPPIQEEGSLVFYHTFTGVPLPCGPRGGILYDLSDEDIRRELLRQSEKMFGGIGMGGKVGPAKAQYDRNRPKGWPHSKSVLRIFGLPLNPGGWGRLLKAYGFDPVTISQVRSSSHFKRFGHIGKSILKRELLRQSDELFGKIGLGGTVGPAKAQYDRSRSKGFPHSRSILRTVHATDEAKSWNRLLAKFGLTPPTPSDIQCAALKKEAITKYRLPEDRDTCPPLMGTHVRDDTKLTPLEDGRFQQTTRSVYQLR